MLLSFLFACARPSSVLDCCDFCQITEDNGFKIVWQNDKFIAFRDRKPAAQYHFLVIPKSHIPSVKSLEKADVNLVHSMQQIGNNILDDLNVPSSMRRMGFHIPPYNSVNHLHLHVHGLPYTSLRKKMKYPVSSPFVTTFGAHKGFSWFVEVGQAIRTLENGGRVGVFPC